MCEVWGVKFYIDGNNYTSFTSSPFVPAWVATPLGKKEADGATATIERFSETYVFKHTPVGEKQSVVDVELSIYALKLKSKDDLIELGMSPAQGKDQGPWKSTED